jgi:4-hydroxy-2-oxoheptanedioate aldolase
MFAPVILGHSTESAYAEEANEQLMVIVQMESKGGVAECEKIAAVDGIDCLFIGKYHLASLDHDVDNFPGPFDLAKQLGVERKGPEHEAAIQRILKAAHGAGKKAAIFCESLRPLNHPTTSD